MANEYPSYEIVPRGGSDIWNIDAVFAILREDYFEIPIVPSVYMPMSYVSGYFYADSTP
jgi:hypothetical protein